MAEGFRECFDRAVRVDEEHDWSVHSVEYSIFKRRLTIFKDRRRRLNALLRNAAPRRTLPEQVVASVIGPRAHNIDTTYSNVGPMGTGYIPFVDSASSAEDHAAPIQRDQRGKIVPMVHERTIAKRISTAERNDIIMFLSSEMDKVVTFYIARWVHLSNRAEEGEVSQELGDEILELLAFCTINIVAIRQTLIRYDAFARMNGGHPMLQWYMKKMHHHQTSFRKVVHHAELNALIDLYQSQIEDPAFDAQVEMFNGILEASERAESVASTGHIQLTETFLQTLRDYFLLGLVEEQLGLDPSYLTMRGQSLTGEMRMIDKWRQQRVAVEPRPEATPKMSFKESFALILTLASAFLYCMNYYIVEPSSTKYVNALDAPDYTSGLLIGMMPIACFCSSIVYSIWSNHSFRMPFLVSGSLLIVGNVIYASAYNSGSVETALLGRFLTGLGGPKIIVRRYMADTTPISLRTGVNAAFGMVIATGSALGPATAILVDRFVFSFWLPFAGVQYFNGMTGPGWFMALLWTIFTLIVFFTFGEPDRSGLEEQRRKEARASASIVSIDSSSPMSPKEQKIDDDLQTVFSVQTAFTDDGTASLNGNERQQPSRWEVFMARVKLVTLPVRLCLLFLFCKTFTIEALVSATSALTKNRYGWQVLQVGILGCINGLLVIPLSMTVGWLSMYYQDRVLMAVLVSIGCFGVFLLIDFSDMVATPTDTYNYNAGNIFAVHPPRYVTGYFLAFCSIQSFEGVIGSTLSKVIPTALASGTFNSGLLATLVDTLGRACGDVFIFLVGHINMRQLMNLLFVPAFTVLVACLVTIRRNYATLAV